MKVWDKQRPIKWIANRKSKIANSMDIARPDIARKKRRQRILYSVAALGALAAITIGLSRLKPAAPLVENVWSDTVKRGPFLRQVRGNGTLVPEQSLWIPTLNAGRVERIFVLPGTAVKADTVLVELSDPEVKQAAFDAEWALKGAEAQLTNLVAQVDTKRLDQQSAVARAQADYDKARLQSEVDDRLAKAGLGLVATNDLQQDKATADELAKLLQIQKEEAKISVGANRAQLAVQEATVAQLQAKLQLARQQVDALQVRAGIDGVLQKLGDSTVSTLQVGQQLSPGATVAQVTDPTRLKAQIQIAETQARDIQLGQPAEVDTRNGIIPGQVVRIDPAVQNGTVTVDVKLEGPLPKGARPDLSVDGTIQLEKLENVLYVGRPVQGQPETTIGLFKLVDAGKQAVRVPVKLGSGSVSTIEILSGLKAGDQVILSDMSTYDSYDRVRLR
jgi:HlyD family secretion protein